MGCESSKPAVEEPADRNKRSHRSNGHASVASGRSGPTRYSAATGPPKFVTNKGVTKMNSEYRIWKEALGGSLATTVASEKALPVITNMAEYEVLNNHVVGESGGGKISLAKSTESAISTMLDPQFCLEAGMTPDTMATELGNILEKYEIPMGLMSKLMTLGEYSSLEFIIDDSGSMNNLSDTKDHNGKVQSRWLESHSRLKEMVEVLAYVPFAQIGIELLNRKDRVTLNRDGRDPRSFLEDAYQKIDRVFATPPKGDTPALEKLQQSFRRGQGDSIARYFFGDGVPDGGIWAQQEITKMVCNRQNPRGNPVTFISVTNDASQVEWMKDTEERAPFCAEADDFDEEAKEVLRDQGVALPYSRGFHLVCQLVAAMNPDDLDAMDESIPFTKTTLDNLLGVTHTDQSFRYYFKCFQEAQRIRAVEKDCNGKSKKSDRLKQSIKWNYDEFLLTPVARQIPQVREFKAQLLRIV